MRDCMRLVGECGLKDLLGRPNQYSGLARAQKGIVQEDSANETRFAATYVRNAEAFPGIAGSLISIRMRDQEYIPARESYAPAPPLCAGLDLKKVGITVCMTP